MGGIFCLKADIAVVSLTPDCTITDTNLLRKPRMVLILVPSSFDCRKKNTRKRLDFFRLRAHWGSIFLQILEFKKFYKKSKAGVFLKKYFEEISKILQKTPTGEFFLHKSCTKPITLLKMTPWEVFHVTFGDFFQSNYSIVH